MNQKTELLQKKTIKELTRTARKAKAEMRAYIEDLEMYSKPEFWEAINETRWNKGKKFSTIKELLAELDG